jgi:hypothetical protein
LAVVLVNPIVHQHQIKMVVLAAVDHTLRVQALELLVKVVLAVQEDLVGAVAVVVVRVV